MAECDYTQCHAILQNSKADTFIFESSQSFTENFYQWIKHTSYEEYRKKVGDGLGIDVNVPIEGIPVGLGLNGSTSKETYERIQDAIDKGTIRNITEDQAKKIIQSNTNDLVYKAWSDCMQSMIEACKTPPVVSPPTGLQVKNIKRRGNEIYITLQSLLFPGDPEVVVENFHVPSIMSCTSGCLNKGDHIVGEHTIILERIMEGEGNVIINTSRNTLNIPLSTYITSEIVLKANKDLVKYMMNKLQQSNYTLPKSKTSVSTGEVTVNLWLKGTLAAFTIFIPYFSNDIVIQTQLGEGQQDIYHPTPGRLYCTDIPQDSNDSMVKFCVTAEEICSVLRASVDSNYPTPIN